MSRLQAFVDAAHRRVQAGAYDLRGDPLPRGPSLRTAIRRTEAVIAELKPRSPSQGRLQQLDPARIVEAYRAGGAAAISVLTDADFFDGDPALLRVAHATGLPVMMKDFIVDARQISCAAHNGASAILLIERILTKGLRESLIAQAHALGLQVLLEIHTPAELDAIEGTAADLIGVNARDLDTLHVDMLTQLALIEDASQDHIVVALSGIARRADRLLAQRYGARAVLVGTTLMQHPDPALALAGIRHTLVKVCGLKRVRDIQHAIAAGADLLGFVTGAPSSARDLRPDAIRPLVAVAHQSGARTVLVTPESDGPTVAAWARETGVDYVQSHATSTALIDALAMISVPVIAAVGPGESYPEGVAGVVFDAVVGGGGSGERHNWERARQRVAERPDIISLIAGGIGPDDAGAAVVATGAWGVDASGGLEGPDGLKDPDRVTGYIRSARQARP